MQTVETISAKIAKNEARLVEVQTNLKVAQDLLNKEFNGLLLEKIWGYVEEQLLLTEKNKILNSFKVNITESEVKVISDLRAKNKTNHAQIQNQLTIIFNQFDQGTEFSDEELYQFEKLINEEKICSAIDYTYYWLVSNQPI